MAKVYLRLENGEVFEGRSFGAEGIACGEVIFVTSMTGYLELLTDPAYRGQIVVQTFPLIGNYGVIPADFEGEKPLLTGYAVREVCALPSNFRCEGRLEDYLQKSGVVGICDIDTRQITRIIREQGTMKGIISNERDSAFIFVPERTPLTEKPVEVVGSGKRIVYVDYGARKSVLTELAACGFEVVRVPHTTTAAEIATYSPAAIVLSEGAGDPKEYVAEIATVKALLGRYPILGTGLGHQLVALAAGGQTAKMKFGHHGSNQPVRYAFDKKTYITAQNHGYEVDVKSLKGKAQELFFNLNDKSNEGLLYRAYNAVTVQFKPFKLIYDKFADMTGGNDYAD